MERENEYTGRNERSYKNDEITVYWKPSACIHASSCYRELIEVFDPGSRPWVDMKGASVDRIIETVNLCPTEALSWKWNDESRNNQVDAGHTNHIKYKRPELYNVKPATSSDTPVTIKIMHGGPAVIEGSYVLRDSICEKKIVNTISSFCRCGTSKTMPYCDGDHRTNGFTD